jgi:hypothetical protein
MNSLKYIFYFLLGFIIYKIINNKVIEGFGENVFPLLARIIGQDEQGDSRTQYRGCQIYECDSRPKYSYDYLNSQEMIEIIEILKSNINEYSIVDSEIESYNNVSYKELLIRNILKIDKANNYVDKEHDRNDLNYLFCNNEMDFSPASLLGDDSARCNHEKCCFNTKCSSSDVQGLTNDDGSKISTCYENTKLKKDARCYSIDDCKNKFQSYCCSEAINDSSHIDSIFSDYENDNDNLLSKTELSYIFRNVDDLGNKLDKLLTNAEVKLDLYDFNDLL